MTDPTSKQDLQVDQRAEAGDVVQLDPEHCRWGAVLVVVTEVRTWGIQGYFLVWRDDGTSGMSFIRAEHAHYKRIGRAEWTAKQGDAL